MSGGNGAAGSFPGAVEVAGVVLIHRFKQDRFDRFHRVKKLVLGSNQSGGGGNGAVHDLSWRETFPISH